MKTKITTNRLLAGLSFVLCLLLPATGLVSCADMMETDSELLEFEKDNTLGNPEDTIFSVMGILQKIQAIADRSVLLGEVRGDLTVVTDDATPDLKRLAAFQNGQANKYNAISDYYAVINNCNYFIAHADTALRRRGRQVFLSEYAAVKTYRAWAYLELAKAYGSVPFTLSPMMTEDEARAVQDGPRADLATICNTLIDDISPYVDTDLPDYGSVGSQSSEKLFIPTRVMLGDLCLWAGRYREAAQWYHDYLADKDKPVTMYTGAATWYSSQFNSVNRSGYNPASSTEVICSLPMESNAFSGVMSEIGDIFNSTKQNNYYASATPSAALRTLSAAQDYCMINATGTTIDTLYAPKTGLNDALATGDLRLYASYSLNSVARDRYSEYSSDVQTIRKLSTSSVTFVRRAMVYLRYAEALNRARLPQSAFAVLKYGLYPQNVTTYVDAQERADAGDLIYFDAATFTSYNTLGIHSRGCGDCRADTLYALPLPPTALATRQDTIDYQVPLVEDMILDEMALEGMFEGNRFYDLMRVALRRGDTSYLANAVARRTGTTDASLQSLLLDSSNWYLKIE